MYMLYFSIKRNLHLHYQLDHLRLPNVQWHVKRPTKPHYHSHSTPHTLHPPTHQKPPLPHTHLPSTPLPKFLNPKPNLKLINQSKCMYSMGIGTGEFEDSCLSKYISTGRKQ